MLQQIKTGNSEKAPFYAVFPVKSFQPASYDIDIYCKLFLHGSVSFCDFFDINNIKDFISNS